MKIKILQFSTLEKLAGVFFPTQMLSKSRFSICFLPKCESHSHFLFAIANPSDPNNFLQLKNRRIPVPISPLQTPQVMFCLIGRLLFIMLLAMVTVAVSKFLWMQGQELMSRTRKERQRCR